MFELRHFLTVAGKDIFEDWLDSLRDLRAQATILARLDRLELGMFGDAKAVGGGVSELRIDVGAGYRVYFARRGKMVLLLLCGGDKSTQSADIKRAIKCLNEFDQREF